MTSQREDVIFRPIHSVAAQIQTMSDGQPDTERMSHSVLYSDRCTKLDMGPTNRGALEILTSSLPARQMDWESMKVRVAFGKTKWADRESFVSGPCHFGSNASPITWRGLVQSNCGEP